MNMENRELLEKVVKERLTEATAFDTDSEEGKRAVDDAVKLMDRQIKLMELEESRQNRISNEEIKVKEAKKDRMVKYIEIAGLVIAVPIIDAIVKRGFAKMLCNFEKDYTFTTTAGRSLSSLFRFKK